MYTIKRAAELTGIPAATLRAWERRYDVVEPHRTDSGYRLYDDAAVARLRDMAALVADGWTASTAAAEVDRRHSEGAASAPAGGTPPSPAVDAPTDVAASPHATTPTDAASREATTRLITAAAAMDPAAVGRVLDERFATASFESVVDDWLLRALDEVGLAWADGRITVAGEHLVAHAVLRRLAAAFDAAASRPGGPRVLVGLPSNVHHELGIFAFAVALRRLGVDVVYLGPDLPADAWRSALDAHDARCAVLAVPRKQDAKAARAVVAALRSADPAVTVLVGGGRQEDLTDPDVVHLGHDVLPAARRVADLLPR
ncbi:MerR family transcriptional regulator [Janibacter anophelis]|uniref:MerR family transcriptional regulator n=1 Tax=Janibacter anophelis TaxID=319054 RepID=UPI0008342B07|nr:MerR family transcriptional regulator [Janibacter anophelis]